MTTANLLVELFVEELPPRSLKALGDAFAAVLFDKLVAQGLTGPDSAVTAFASPRRLAAHVSGVRDQAPPKSMTYKLMPASVGLGPEGQPTAALLKKLAALGHDVDAVQSLRRQADAKTETLYLDEVAEAVTLPVGLQLALDEALAKLPIPKVMQYQLADGWTSVHFVRPAHGLVALHGARVVPVTVLGLQSGRLTHGHRFESTADPIELGHADGYALSLKTQGAVIASFAERRADIVAQLAAAAQRLGLAVVQDEALLDEVTALVERPNVLCCQFDEQFLSVPAECLILTMKANQKYFPLLGPTGELNNRFLVVSNIRPADPGHVVRGNERVVRPRLADAKFFFDQDRKRTLESRLPGLEGVVYHGKLGSQGDRSRRVAAIAGLIAERIGADALAEQAVLAARLAKADLLTDMVGEFPELQGTMGRYYALHDGHPPAIAFAIEDHYKPRFSGDELPRSEVGTVVALADKLETLIGLFGVGQRPSGDKDPFALRRHALGIVRMLVERDLPLDVTWLIDAAQAQFRARSPAAVLAALEDAAPLTQQIEDFLRDRLAIVLQDQGNKSQDVDAVMSLRPQRLAQVVARVRAVEAFRQWPESAQLAAANKRVGNILKKIDPRCPPAAAVRVENLTDPAEKALHAALTEVGPAANRAFEGADYVGSLKALSSLQGPVDAFFDAVMVNAEDLQVRANRLALLEMLRDAMNRVADLSKLSA